MMNRIFTFDGRNFQVNFLELQFLIVHVMHVVELVWTLKTRSRRSQMVNHMAHKVIVGEDVE